MNLRKLARGKPCQVRVPGECNNNPETTVLAHLNGGGMGMKHPDLLGAWACSGCHWWLDQGYVQKGHHRSMRDLYHLQGIKNTQEKLLDMGLDKVLEQWEG